MLPPSVKRRLLLAHRWLALAFTPIFLAILLSGAVLAVKPMLPAQPPVAATAHAVAQVLAKVDPQGQVSAVSGGLDGHGLTVTSRNEDASGVYSLLTGKRVGDVPVDVFAIAKSLHVGLLSGAGFLVKMATYVMAALILSAPFLMWPRLRASARGLHVLFGWIGFPLLLLTPLTAVLLTLHVGRADLPLQPSKEPLALARALEDVGRDHLREAFVSARRFKGGSALVTLRGETGTTTYMVGDTGVAPMAESKGLVSELHEGTWAGAWSGALNMAAALGLCVMIVTGWWSWLKRRVVAPQPRRPALLTPPGASAAPAE